MVFWIFLCISLYYWCYLEPKQKEAKKKMESLSKEEHVSSSDWQIDDKRQDNKKSLEFMKNFVVATDNASLTPELTDLRTYALSILKYEGVL